MKRVTSLANPVVKHIRSLYLRKGRERAKMAVLEGTRLIQDGIARGVRFGEALCSESFYQSESGSMLICELSAKGAEVILVPDSLIERISDTETPQGIIASIAIEEPSISEVFFDLSRLFLILDGVQDPGNVGTLIRTGAAAGVGCVILTKGCADVYNPKTLRSTMGAVFAVPVIERVEPRDVIDHIKTAGVNLVVADGEGETDYCDPWYTGKTCLVIGNEAHGVSDVFLDVADVRVKIPMMNDVESLNAAVAGSILLYEAYRQSIT